MRFKIALQNIVKSDIKAQTNSESCNKFHSCSFEKLNILILFVMTWFLTWGYQLSLSTLLWTIKIYFSLLQDFFMISLFSLCRSKNPTWWFILRTFLHSLLEKSIARAQSGMGSYFYLSIWTCWVHKWNCDSVSTWSFPQWRFLLAKILPNISSVILL